MRYSTIPARPPYRPRTLPRRRFFPACLALALCTLSATCQILLPPPPTPVPPAVPPASPAVIARVTAAKTIFVSNAGANDPFSLEITGGPNVSYNELYAALQQWGYFQLVDSPANADLIFQIRSNERAPHLVQTFDNQHIIPHQHAPELVLSILDPHDPAIPIDTITTLAGRGDTKPKGRIAFAQSIEWLTYQLSTRVSAPRSNPGKLLDRDALRPSFETLINSTAPVPPQVLNVKNVYVVNDPAPVPAPEHDFKAFTDALATWNYYHLTDDAHSADIILRYHRDEADGTWLTLEDPTTKAILWTITDPRHGFYHGPHRIMALDQNLITELKLLNHIPVSQSETAARH